MKIEDETEENGEGTVDINDAIAAGENFNFSKKEMEKGFNSYVAETAKKEEEEKRELESNTVDVTEFEEDAQEQKEEHEEIEKVIDYLDDDEEYDIEEEEDGFEAVEDEGFTESSESEEEADDGEVEEEEGDAGYEPSPAVSYFEQPGDFYEDDDDDYFDPQEESLIYSSSSDSVLFNELNNDTTEEEEKRNEDLPREKTAYKPIGGGAKPGKLMKNRILLVIVSFFLIMILGVSFFVKRKEKIEAEKAAVDDDYIGLDGYNPDFGDYKSRAYRKKEEDTGNPNEEALEKIEQILGGEGKAEFVDENKKTSQNKPQQSTSQAQPQYNQPSSASSQSNADDTYQQRVEASLRKGGEGFGYSTKVSDYGGMYGGGDNTGGGYDMAGYTPETYMNNVKQLSESLSQGRGTNQQNDRRSYNDGNYDRNAQGGNFSSIPQYSIYPGTIIHAVMINGINTDYPGNITARVINNVYDSKTGKNLLIPGGSILRGTYSSASIGINRIQIAWQTLIVNRDGRDYIIELGSMVGVDRTGYSGIKGSLNDHAFAYLKAAGISSLYTYINSNIFEVTNAQKNKTVQQMISDSQDIGNKLADKILDRALDIQPTVKVKPGTRISVDVDKILTLIPYDRDMPTQRYIRK